MRAREPRPLRILHCMRAPVGGLFRHVNDLATEQAARGHAVGIIADASAADALTRSRLEALRPSLALGLALIPMSRRPGIGDAGATRAVLDVARRIAPDVLHGHGAKGGAYARLAGAAMKFARRRLAVAYTPHGGSLHFPADTAAGMAFTLLERALRVPTDGLVFESDFARRAYASRVGLGHTPARVIANGVGDADFATAPPAPDATDLVFVGELRYLKGVDLLLSALARLNRTRRVTATIVGDGPDAAEFRALAESLGVSDRVRFPGAMPARKAFALGRALVVPSRAESFPYIVLEAGAAGRPLVATAVGGIPEIVAGTGIDLVPPDDVTALTKAIDVMLAAPATAAARAAELQAKVRDDFTVSVMTGSVLSFYRSLLPEAA